MISRRFCFRFDVDTHLCIRTGVPNLLDLARELNCRFTFFVNMGRAVSLADSLRDLMIRRTSKEEQAAPHLSPLAKFGPGEFFRAVLLNPRVGTGAVGPVRRIDREGHEVGLHGGRNHALWGRHSHEWSRDVLADEVRWGLNQLREAGVRNVYGFSSPCWAHPPELAAVLREEGFVYHADIGGETCHSINETCGSIKAVKTRILANPAGVAYLENARARGLTQDVIEKDVRQRLREQTGEAVIYDHPYYAGIHELDLVRRIIVIAREEGFDVTTLSDMAKDC